MTKKEAALAYADRGWKVFPCAPKTKIPLAGTHGVRDATDDKSQIEIWWAGTPDANIGLACGDASGVWVIDIDIRRDTGVDGFQSIMESGKKIGRTLSQITPSGGRHFLYSCTGAKPANKNGFLRGVDIRGDGYYIVVSPSETENGAYEWDSDFTEMTEFPEAFKPSKAASVPVFKAIPPACTTPSAPATDRARAYLEQIPGAVEHVDGHAKLFWVAQVLVNGFRLSDEEAHEIMWNEYNPRCVPPWDRNRSTEREFRHKISEAHAKPNPEACAIYDAMPDRAPIDDFDFDKCIADVRALLAPKVRTVVSHVTNPITKSEAQVNDLLIPQGLVGDIAKWMSDTAFCYQPMLALGASLTLCGAIMGRKVCDESNGRTNLYCIGIGPSSSGKDHPGDCINKILTESGAQGLMMGRMTSDSAIEKALTISPSKIAIMDEVGHFFSNINSAGDGAAYLKTIKPTLMELFSSSHKTYIGKQKASEMPTVIDQPCMCIWGVTAPEKLYAGMTIEELQDGWIARNLVFIASDNIPDIVIKPAADVPQSIVESVRSWMMRTNGDMLITASPGGMQKPIMVPMDADARARFNEFNVYSRERMKTSRKNGDKTQYLWGKALQNARRIALIVACGREYENPVISAYDANYGCRLVEYLIRDTIRAIDNNVNENKWEEDKNRILKMIAATGIDGMPGKRLCGMTKWVKDSRVRSAYLSDLVESGEIVNVATGGICRGRPKTVWMTADNADAFERMNGIERSDDYE